MTSGQTEENPILKSAFQEIWKALQQREVVRLALSEYSVADIALNNNIHKLVNEIDSIEKSLLSNLVELFDHVELALRRCGAGLEGLKPIQCFRPFKIAIMLTSSNPLIVPVKYYGIIERKNIESSSSSIFDVIITVEVENRVWPQMDLVEDLLQYWEMFLRYQTPLECSDFCQGCRKYLLGRVSSNVSRDAAARNLPRSLSEYSR